MHRRFTVVGYVCVLSLIFLYSNESTNGSSQHCERFYLNRGVFVEQSIRKATEFALKLLAQLSAIWFAFASVS